MIGSFLFLHLWRQGCTAGIRYFRMPTVPYLPIYLFRVRFVPRIRWWRRRRLIEKDGILPGEKDKESVPRKEEARQQDNASRKEGNRIVAFAVITVIVHRVGIQTTKECGGLPGSLVLLAHHGINLALGLFKIVVVAVAVLSGICQETAGSCHYYKSFGGSRCAIRSCWGGQLERRYHIFDR